MTVGRAMTYDRGVLVALLGIVAAASATAVSAEPDVPAAVLQAQADRVATIARARNSVVAIFGSRGSEGGSGIVISRDGYALTNFHVVVGTGAAMKSGLPDGRLYDTVIVGVDPTGDVALVKLLGRDDFHAAELGDSDTARPGDWVFAMGNPFLLATDFQPSVSYGIVSGVHRYQYPAGSFLEYTDCLQIDAAINPGNSGGPLFDSAGRLIGVNGRASFEKRGRVNVGVAYAISINQIKNFLGCLRGGRIVDHATLGARLATDADGTVRVAEILEECDARRRGLHHQDELVRFAGRSIRTVNEFKNVLGIIPAGWRVPIAYRRGGEIHEALVRLESVHAEAELWKQLADRPRSSDDIATIPEAVVPYYEKRTGYANFYFNRENQDRVFRALAASGSFDQLAGPWTITGQVEAGGQITLRLKQAEAACRLPMGESMLSEEEDLTAALDSAGDGGLLLAMHLWRKLLVAGSAGFDDLYYYGTWPLSHEGAMADVLVAQLARVECQFAFDSRDGRVATLELSTEASGDSCRVEFAEPQEVDGRWLPGRVTLHRGDRAVGSYKLEQFSFDPSRAEGE